MAHTDDAALADGLARQGDEGAKDLFRRRLEQALQQLIDAELTAAIGAAPHERTKRARTPTSPRATRSRAGAMSLAASAGLRFRSEGG